MVSSVIMPNADKSCPQGFSLTNENNITICKDNNECESEITTCSHLCKNIIGGYTCACPSGYKISQDQQTCEGKFTL